MRYFLRLGSIGFGGPVALIGYMHRDLVTERQWISEADYREGLALAQNAPGPLAAQLAIYLGCVHYHLLGATLVGLAFVLPSFLMVLALSVAYTVYGGLPWMQAMFYGVGAGVIGIMAVSASKLTRQSLGTDRWRWGYYLVAAVTVVTHTEPVLLLVGARVVQWRRVARRPRGSLRAGRWPAGGLPRGTGGSHYGARCADADFLVFDQGGRVRLRQRAGHRTVPHAGVVDEYGWLTDAQFLDAVALAMITPGPVVITVAIIGTWWPGCRGPAWRRWLPFCRATC